MKKISLTLIILFSLGILKAQILHPVHWSYGAKVISKDKAVIFLKATIDDGWHIYSTTQKDGGPVKTSFAFKTSTDYMLDGSIAEPDPITRYEKSFEMDVNYFERTVIFRQKVNLKTVGNKHFIVGTLNFMACNDHQCLPPETLDFKVQVD